MNKNYKILLFFVTVSVVVAVLTNTTYFQKFFKPSTDSEFREILSKVTAFYGPDQKQFLILKIKQQTGLSIEIFEVLGPEQQEFKQKFELSEDSDAYVTVDKSSTNLALSDLDKDGFLDIMAPSVDRNGNLRLNSFRFNIDLMNFEPLLNPEIN